MTFQSSSSLANFEAEMTDKWSDDCRCHLMKYLGASGSVMVCKLDLQTYTSEFESHWVPHSYGLVPYLSKKLSKLPLDEVLGEDFCCITMCLVGFEGFEGQGLRARLCCCRYLTPCFGYIILPHVDWPAQCLAQRKSQKNIQKAKIEKR